MNNVIVKNAIVNAMSLLNGNIENDSFEELEAENKKVLEDLEKALLEMNAVAA